MIPYKEKDIREIKGIGDKQALLFSKLKIFTLKDLLYHIPFRYLDTSSISSITEFKEKGEGTFLAKIIDIKTTYFRKTITTVKVEDETDSLRLTFFNQGYLQKTLKKEDLYLFNAKITTKGNRKNIYNPKFEIFKYDPSEQLHIGKMIGVYPETKGLTSRTIRSRIKSLVDDIADILLDPLRKADVDKLSILPLQDAIKKIHFPNSEDDITYARERLAFDEMLQIAIKIEQKLSERRKQKANPMHIESKYLNKYIKGLPFKLTGDQNLAIEEILADLSRDIPMNRLLNGDVGSGKTVVASTAILNSIKNGYSCVLLAPTTVLAKQHYDTFKKLFQGQRISIELCISSEKTISEANNKLIIGTHAVLEEKILPKDLNLIIIDEQHRFGVEQREYFKKDTITSPHYLTMTATPIPRTLTEIFFGSMDVSEIKEKPAERKVVKTFFTPLTKRNSCLEWTRERILESQKGEQAFIIYPLIEESELSSSKSILNEFEKLREIFKGLKIEYLHGRLKPELKDNILNKFRKKEIDVLVSTTVIEVGIDIPDATIMIIEDAERFGLAQLHQLRGRVGRSNKESFCFVIAGESVEKDSEAEKRLIYFSKNSSGFDVAEYDLKHRGPGEVYGTAQSGIPNFKVANLFDTKLLKKTRVFAKKLLKEDNDPKDILENLFR